MDEDKKTKKESSEKDELVWKDEDKEEGEGESVKGEENDEGEKKEEEVENDLEESEEEKEDVVDDEAKTEEEEPKEEETPSTHEDIKKSDILRRDLNQFVRDNQPSYSLNPQNRGSSKKLVTLILFILAILVIGGGVYFIAGLGGGAKKEPSPAPTSSVTPLPTPTPKALNREEWSLEVLNGSGVTGEAKKIADQLKSLGYPVIKVGNADKDDYTSNQFFVKKELEDSVELVINDIKDIIKIASVSGELTDSTASARIIIGK